MASPVAIVLALACAFPGDPGGLSAITPSTPQQVPTIEDITIVSNGSAESPMVVVSIVASDSTLHAGWIPTLVTLSSDLGISREYAAIPFACITKAAGSARFPFSLEWWSCNRIFVEVGSILTDDEVGSLEGATTGRIITRRANLSAPGETFVVEVPVGAAAVAEAVRRARLLAFVSSASRVSDDPICVLSDEVPPPPCPAWSLVVRVPFSHLHGTAAIPVSAGGWIRATYMDRSGAAHSAKVIIP